MRTRPLCTRANWMMLPFPFFHICWSCHNTARHRKCAYGSWLYESTTSYCIESIPLHHRSAIYIWLLRACTTHTSPNRPSPLHSPRRTDIAGCRPYECVAPFAHEYPQYSFINNNSEYAMVTCAAHRTFFFLLFLSPFWHIYCKWQDFIMVSNVVLAISHIWWFKYYMQEQNKQNCGGKNIPVWTQCISEKWALWCLSKIHC